MAKEKELDARMEAMEEILAEQAETIKRAGSATISTEMASPKNLLEFSAGGKRYRFKVHAFNTGTEVIQASEAVNDPNLLERIVRDFPGVVEEI